MKFRRMVGYGPVAAIFGAIDLDTWREAVFQLSYTQHGGSGLSLGGGYVMDMPLADLSWFQERLGEERSKEAAAIKRSQKGKR